jgi:hypothetical protein
LLHRDHRPRDDKGRIVATIDDYDAAYYLLADRLAQGAGTKLKGNDKKVLDQIKAIEEARETDGKTSQGVTTHMLVAELKLNQATVNRRLNKLMVDGYIENLTPGKGRTAHYRAIGRPDNVEVLPSTDALEEAWEDWKQKRREPPTPSPEGSKSTA